MKSKDALALENRLLRMAARGESVLIAPYGGKSMLVTRGEEGLPIAIEVVDIRPVDMKAVVDNLGVGPSVSFYDLPKLTVDVSHPGIPDTKVDAAAVLMAAWHDGEADLFDELCIHVWDDWMGYPGAAMAGPIALHLNGKPAAVSSDDFTDTEVTVSRSAFSDWLRKLRNSDNEDIAHFGNGLTRSHRHFRNHDLEGNRYNRAGDIVDNDGVALA